MQSKLFDHKAIFLELNTPPVPLIKLPIVSRFILKEEDVNLVVLAAVAETYLIHANGDQFQGNEKAQMLENVGMIKHLIRRAGPPLKYLVSEPSDENYIHNHMAAIQEAKLLGEDFILADLENLILDTEADVFLEILLNNIKNDVISYQCFIAKEKKNTYNKLVNDIKLAKTNYVGQCDKITNLENK